MCACDAQGVCYNVTDATNDTVFYVYLYSICDAGKCFYLLTLECSDYLNEYPYNVSGLSSMATGELVYTCAEQGTDSPTLNSSVPFVKPVSISCSACVNTTTCNGVFSPSSSTNAT